MTEPNPSWEDQASALMKIWAESWTKLAEGSFSFSPGAAPPEMLRQMRSGFLQALARCWDDYLRSPEFAKRMKEMMDGALAVRKLSNEILAKTQRDLGVVNHEDLDAVLLSLRHLQNRVLDRLDGISNQVAALNQRLDQMTTGQPGTTMLPEQGRIQNRRSKHGPRPPGAPAS
jgi:hypothetical protein